VGVSSLSTGKDFTIDADMASLSSGDGLSCLEHQQQLFSFNWPHLAH